MEAEHFWGSPSCSNNPCIFGWKSAVKWRLRGYDPFKDEVIKVVEDGRATEACPWLISVVSHKQWLSTSSAGSSGDIFALASLAVSLSKKDRLYYWMHNRVWQNLCSWKKKSIAASVQHHWFLLFCQHFLHIHTYQCPLDELFLAFFSIFFIATPGFKGRGLQGTSIWEGQGPGPVQRALVHGIQIDGGLLLTLATRQESDALTGIVYNSLTMSFIGCHAEYSDKNSRFRKKKQVFINACVCKSANVHVDN